MVGVEGYVPQIRHRKDLLTINVAASNDKQMRASSSSEDTGLRHALGEISAIVRNCGHSTQEEIGAYCLHGAHKEITWLLRIRIELDSSYLQHLPQGPAPSSQAS